MWMFILLGVYVGVLVWAWAIAVDSARRERAERVALSRERTTRREI